MDVLKIADQHLRKDPIRARHAQSKPRLDHGFFGPESMTWKVGLHPGGAAVGLLRSSYMLMVEPMGADAIAKYSVMKADPLTRARRSITFFQATAFGDSQTAIRAARTLYRIHTRIESHEPVTQRDYRATDAENALWTFLLGAYSILVSYRQFAGGLTEAQELQFMREQVTTAQLLGLEPELIPTTHAGYRAFFDEWAPRLCLTAAGHDAVEWFKAPPWRPLWPMAVFSPGLRVIFTALAGRMPTEFRQLSHLEPSSVASESARLTVTAVTRALTLPPLTPAMMLVSPEGYGTMRQALNADPQLPLADVPADLHLSIRDPKAPGSAFSDHEDSPHIGKQAA